MSWHEMAFRLNGISAKCTSREMSWRRRGFRAVDSIETSVGEMTLGELTKNPLDEEQNEIDSEAEDNI